LIIEFDNSLLKKAQHGEKDAQDEFLLKNKGLVYLVVKKFVGRGTDNEDLIQLGMIGLYKAMMNFSESYDVKFSTYAVPMISGEIKRFLRDDGMVKVSRNVKELYIKIKYAQSKFETKFSKAPKMSDLANELGVSIEDIIYTLNASESVYSLEETIDSDENKLYLKDKIADDKAITEEQIVDKIALKEMLSKLDGKKRQVIMFRFFNEMTQEQVAKILGISQVQVCRIEKKVLKELKNMYISST